MLPLKFGIVPPLVDWVSSAFGIMHDDHRGRVRGAALRELLEWHRARHGESAVASTIESLGEEGAALQLGLPAFGVLSRRWYEAKDIHLLLDAIGQSHDAETLAREGGRIVTERTLSGLFRAVFRLMATPTRYAAHAQKLWSQYYDTGVFRVEPDEAAGRSITTIEGWASHHPILCSINVTAAEVIYEAMGCTSPRARRLACVEYGAPACRYEVRWLTG